MRISLFGKSLLLLGLICAVPASHAQTGKKADSSVQAAPSVSAKELQALHVLNRLGYGPSPGDIDRVLQKGVEAYIQQQLHPESLQMSAALSERLMAVPDIHSTDAALYADYGPPQRKAAAGDQAKIKAVTQRQNQVADAAREAHLLRAVYSPAQLQETMVDFWFNHFNVFAGKGQETKIWTGNFERDAIRPHVFGRFRDLLGATAKHPAMLNYLDNQKSTSERIAKNGKKLGGLNENYAREVMELHTLGVDDGYTQADVTALARIFTGWGYDPKRLVDGVDPAFFFNSKKHDENEKKFLGNTFAAGGGEEEGERALDLLAAHPATTRHLSYKIAQYFVADSPPPQLVEKLAKRWRETGGDVGKVLDTLFKSPEFWSADAVGKKFKTPWQYLVSSLRATGLPMVTNVKPLLGMLRQNGQTLYGCTTPDGYKNTQAEWLNSDALILRLNFANALGSGNLPLWKSLPTAAASSMSADDNAGMMAMIEKQPELTASKARAADPFLMQAALGNAFSQNTLDAWAIARPQLRAGLILGSPEFMRR
ncbi:MAG: DUF1800 domain-containing protein [Stagnimonas sp.]|nr:DUF1800 domain-containing protein [Stagnimonas sp.]